MNKRRWITAAGILAGAALVVIFAVMVYESQYRGPYKDFAAPNGTDIIRTIYVGQEYNYLQLGWAGLILSCGLVITGAAILAADIKKRSAPELLLAVRFALNVIVLGLIIFLFVHGCNHTMSGVSQVPYPTDISRLMIFAFMAALPATVLSCLPLAAGIGRKEKAGTGQSEIGKERGRETARN